MTDISLYIYIVNLMAEMKFVFAVISFLSVFAAAACVGIEEKITQPAKHFIKIAIVLGVIALILPSYSTVKEMESSEEKSWKARKSLSVDSDGR